LAAYRHNGFWQCMDTMRDKQYLENLWLDGRAPWRVWSDRDKHEDKQSSPSTQKVVFTIPAWGKK